MTSYKNSSLIMCFQVLLLITPGIGCGDAHDGDHNDSGSVLDATVSEAASSDGAAGPFDLTLTLKSVFANQNPWQTELYIAVRDAETKALLKFVHNTDLTGKVVLKLTDALVAGHRFQIGVLSGWYAGCLDSYATVLYKEVPPVAGDVVLDLTLTKDQDKDTRGCDVLHQGVALKPGTYSHTQPIFGAQDGIAIVVSKTGRVYRKRAFVLCPNTPSGCYSSLMSQSGTCTAAITPVPGDKVVTLGNYGSHTDLDVTATIDVASGGFSVTGKVKTWTTGLTTCCEQTFQTSLVKTSDQTEGCL